MSPGYKQELVFETSSFGYESATRGNVQRMSRTIRGLDAGQRRAERREQLLDAALKLFAANGYLGTSIEQICSTAYIGTKSFYELFSSREECYLALLQRTSERLEEQVADAAAQATGNERQEAPRLLATFVHALVDDPRDHQGHLRHGRPASRRRSSGSAGPTAAGRPASSSSSGTGTTARRPEEQRAVRHSVGDRPGRRHVRPDLGLAPGRRPHQTGTRSRP